MNISTIKQEVEDFRSKNIKIVPGYSFNQLATIEQNILYFNSQYITGNQDTDGMRKYFFNIVRNPCKVTTKAIDFDTKHISIQTASGGTAITTWYFEKDLKFWMKDKGFGSVLNRIFTELPIWGSVVLKVIKGVPYFVDLRNFICTQDADNLDGADMMMEVHHYTPMEFRNMGKANGWQNVEDAIRKFRENTGQKKKFITIYERYGEVETDGKYEYRRVIMADNGTEDKSVALGYEASGAGTELESVIVEKHPYWEFHLEKIPGRWLGVSIVEVLTDPQIRQNEIINLQVKSGYWSALRIWQSRDNGINRNLFTDVENGEILSVDSEITQVDMADRNLAMVNQETERWMNNRDELTFSYDVIRGERLPAGTPLGSAKLAAGMTSSHFDQIRESIALDMKKFLYEVIIPQFKNENNPEHYLRLAGEDVGKINKLIINQKTIDSLFEFTSKKNKLPTKTHFETMKAGIEERVKQDAEKMLKIPKSFYQNLKYKIDIIITGEQKDTSAMTQVYFAALQAITTDPTILQDPAKRKIFFKALENSGVNIEDIMPDTEPKGVRSLMQPKGAGGGVSRPTPVATTGGERKI